MSSDSDFFAQSFDVVGRDALCTKLDFHWECPGGQGTLLSGVVRVAFLLALHLVDCHFVAQYVQLGVERYLVEFKCVVLVAFNMLQCVPVDDGVGGTHYGQDIGVVGKSSFVPYAQSNPLFFLFLFFRS